MRSSPERSTFFNSLLEEPEEHDVPVFMRKADKKIILAILNRAKKLSEERNRLLHAIWFFGDDGRISTCFHRKGSQRESAVSIDDIDDNTDALYDSITDLIAFMKDQQKKRGWVIQR
jgi:hypothetical protein